MVTVYFINFELCNALMAFYCLMRALENIQYGDDDDDDDDTHNNGTEGLTFTEKPDMEDKKTQKMT